MRRFTLSALLTAILLPIFMIVLIGLRCLLMAMNDAAGAHFLERITLGLAVVWVVNLVLLVLAQAAITLLSTRDAEDGTSE